MAVSTRVELHDPGVFDYPILHTAMAQQGFSRQIVDLKGVPHDLPPAEYVHQGAMDRAEALRRAGAAAASTNCRYSIFVTEASGWTWSGLN